MKHALVLLIALLVVSSLRAAEPMFVPIPLEQASGAKALTSSKEDEWSTIPQGRQVYDRVPYDVVTKLRLAGNTDSRDGRLYVSRILGIPVGQRLSRLHLLHAANITGIDEQPVAALQLHYADGVTQTLFIAYGVHVRNFYREDPDMVDDPNSRAVWRGPRPGSTPGRFLRSYKTTFSLRVESPLDHIDAFSLFGKSSLAIFALTGEVAAPGEKLTPTPSGDDSKYREDLLVKVLDRFGNPIQGARVQGVALGSDGRPTALGRMDDAASEPSLVPVDFPAGTRELRLVAAATDFVSGEKAVQAVPGKPFSREVTVRLDPGVRVGGIVYTPEGQPLAKARVGIYRVTHDAAGEVSLFRYVESTTDKRGRWSASEVPEAMESLRFQVIHADFRTLAMDFSGDGTGQLTRETLRAAKSEFRFVANPQITGNVRDDKGQALANVDVTFVCTNKSNKDEAVHARTDAQGQFHFPVTGIGRGRVVVREPNFSPLVRLVDLDQPPQPLTISLTTGKPLKLRALEAKTQVQPVVGMAVRGASMAVLESSNASRGEVRGEILWNAPTDARSEVLWEHPAQGTPDAPGGLQEKVLIRATAPGFHTAWQWVDPNAGNVSIDLHRYVPWHVRAVDADTKALIPVFTTMNHNATNLSSSYGPAVARNGEVVAGYFVEAWLKPRLLTIEAPGYEKFRHTLIPELGATNTYELKRQPKVP